MHLKAIFMASHQSCGSRRLGTAMVSEGFQLVPYKVRSLMRQTALKPVWKRKLVDATDIKLTCRSPPTCSIGGSVHSDGVNLVYVNDVTCSRTGAG